MTQRRAFLAGFSGLSIGIAQAAPPKLPGADDGGEKGACPRCGRVHELDQPLKQTGKP